MLSSALYVAKNLKLGEEQEMFDIFIISPSKIKKDTKFASMFCNFSYC